MKRFLILLSLLFCNVVFADTINLHWLNEDGSTYENSTCVIDSDLILPATPPTKYGYTFTGWKMTNYIPIEYLEVVGTQWIDTDLEFKEGEIKVLAHVYYESNITGERDFIGNMNSDGFCSGIYDQNHAFVWGRGGNANIALLNPTGWHNFVFIEDMSQNKISVDESQFIVTTRSAGGAYSNVNVFIGCGGINRFKCLTTGDRLGIIKIFMNGILVRDFIPVLDKNGVPCLFDKVEAKFYYNQGTGQFIAGPSL